MTAKEIVPLAELIRQAETAFQTGDYQTAEDRLIIALEYCPQKMDWMFLLGHTYFERQEYASALACYTNILARAPQLAPVHSSRAAALQSLGRALEAKTVAEHALTLEPDEPLALSVLARFHLASGEGIAARGLCRRLLALDPTDLQTRQLLTQAETLCHLHVASQPVQTAFQNSDEATPSVALEEILSQ